MLLQETLSLTKIDLRRSKQDVSTSAQDSGHCDSKQKDAKGVIGWLVWLALLADNITRLFS